MVTAVLETHARSAPAIDDLRNWVWRGVLAAERGQWQPVLRLWWRWSGVLWQKGAWGSYRQLELVALDAARNLAGESGVARLVEGLVLSELGWLHMESDNFREADRHWQDAARTFDEIQDGFNLARVHRYQAALAYRRRRFRWFPWVRGVERPACAALTLLTNDELIKSSPMRTLRRDLELLVGATLVDNVEDGGYTEDLDRVRVIHMLEIHMLLAALAARRWDWRDALGHLLIAQAALPSTSSSNDPYAYWRVGLALREGRILLAQLDLERAATSLEHCLELARRAGRPDMQAAALLSRGECHEQAGEFSAAVTVALAARDLYAELGKYHDLRRAEHVARRSQTWRARHLATIEDVVICREADSEVIEWQFRWTVYRVSQRQLRRAAATGGRTLMNVAVLLATSLLRVARPPANARSGL